MRPDFKREQIRLRCDSSGISVWGSRARMTECLLSGSNWQEDMSAQKNFYGAVEAGGSSAAPRNLAGATRIWPGFLQANFAARLGLTPMSTPRHWPNIGQQLDGAHPQWEIQADYLGQLCAHVVLTLSPQRIVMGGGVMTQLRLLPLVRQRLRHWLGGYINRREILADADRYVVAPALHSQAGILGALGLAMDAASSA